MPTDEDLPFTTEEVARALGISPDRIRKIKREWDGFEIKFKPSFDLDGLKQRMKGELKRNDIEHSFFSHNQDLTIYSDGAKDFVRYVKRHS